MVFRSNPLSGSPALATLITEGLALLGLGLAFTMEYWMDTAGSPPQSAIMGALFLFFSICAGVVAAIMLIVNVIRNRIDMGTVISVVPFLGVAVWGVWYSYTDVSWASNQMIYWVLVGIISALLIYIIIKLVKQGRV